MIARLRWIAAVALVLAPSDVTAQPAPSGAGATPQSGLWGVVGGAVTAVRRGCQTCDERMPSRHTGSLIVDAGYRIDRRTVVGAEVAWVPVSTASARRSTTHIDAIARFRPWATRGFFVKGGAGMAFVRNALEGVEERPAISKALSLVVGAGWTLRPDRRVAYELFGTQHAAALGDLQTSGGQVNDVLTNFWSAGVAIVVHYRRRPADRARRFQEW